MHTPQFNFTQYPSGKEGLGFIDIRGALGSQKGQKKAEPPNLPVSA